MTAVGGAHARIIQAVLEQFGRRGAVVLVVHRHQHMCEHHQSCGGTILSTY